MLQSDYDSDSDSSSQSVKRRRKLGQIPPLDLSLDHIIRIHGPTESVLSEIEHKAMAIDKVKEELVPLLKLGEESDAHRAPSELLLLVSEPLQELSDSLEATQKEGNTFASLLYASTNIHANSSNSTRGFALDPLFLSDFGSRSCISADQSHMWSPFRNWTRSIESEAYSTHRSLRESKELLLDQNRNINNARRSLKQPPELNTSAFQTLDTLQKQLETWVASIVSAQEAFSEFEDSFGAVIFRLDTMMRTDESINLQSKLVGHH